MALARVAQSRTIDNSVETGSGASTLLLSHLSDRHLVFALDAGNGSVTNIRRSPLLRPGAVIFVEGPTQSTLPSYRFTAALDLVLIDGPHAYPFPDLEYYFLYPHLKAGGILILDDIHIPTVHHLFQFVRRDAMFELDQVVDTTAFFTRTSAPVFDPFGDGWRKQNYNASPLLRYTWREKLRRALPPSLWRGFKQLTGTRARGSVQIDTPASGTMVDDAGIVSGSAILPSDSYLWILARRKDADGWWPQGERAVTVGGKRWSVLVSYGEPSDAGFDFEIAALAVGRGTHELWNDWVARVRETRLFPPVQLPSSAYIIAEAYRTVQRNRG